MIPVVGNVADLANAGISAVRGDRVGMALSLMSAIPIVGAAGPAAKLGRKAIKPKKLSKQLKEFNRGLQKNHLQKTKDGASFILPSLEERMHMMKVGIKKLEKKTCSGFLSMNCFTAGTLVQTTNGLIEIERITRGMYVWSQNPETGDLGERRVLSSSETTVRKLYHLQINGCKLQTTVMHPFMVEGKGFGAAQDLELGDRVIGIQANGRIQVNALEAIEVVYYEEPQRVYNFEVAEWHTYFIEEQGFLVHNGRKCVGEKPPKVTKKPSTNVPKRLHVKGNKERYVVKRGKGKSGRTGTVDDIIRDGSQIENGKLKPNVKYQTSEHEYIYKTNGDGLISNASTDNLQIKTHEGRLNHNPNTYGKETGDHAEHIFGDRFGGSPELDNLVSQAKQVNLSEFKVIENEWAKALGNGKKVMVDIDINYSGSSGRPSSFDESYTTDDVPFFKYIKN